MNFQKKTVGEFLAQGRPVPMLNLTGLSGFEKLVESSLLLETLALAIELEHNDDRSFTDDDLKLLSESPNFKHLRWLSLSFTKITEKGLGYLARSILQPNLSYVNIAACDIPDENNRLAKFESAGYEWTGQIVHHGQDPLGKRLAAISPNVKVWLYPISFYWDEFPPLPRKCYPLVDDTGNLLPEVLTGLSSVQGPWPWIPISTKDK